jgi:hypothetical protein
MTASEGPSLHGFRPAVISRLPRFFWDSVKKQRSFDQKKSEFSHLSIHNFQLYLRVPLSSLLRISAAFHIPKAKARTPRQADANE